MGAGLDLSGRRRDGTEFPVEISLSPIETPRGRFVSAAIRDATERRKVEARFRGLLESAPDAMVIVDGAGRIVLVNAQAEAIFGYPRAELLGQPLEMLIPERYRARHVGHRADFFRHPKARPMGANLDLYARRRDGTEFPVEISLSPLETEEGVLVSTAIRDVTERRRVEDALRSQTMTRTLVRRLLVGLIHRGGIQEGTVRAMGRELARESGVTTLEENIQAFRDMGLGDLRLDSQEGRTYAFTGDDLLERRAQAPQPTCYLSLSYLEGAVARATGEATLGTEIRCQSQGHERCRFVVVARPAPSR